MKLKYNNISQVWDDINNNKTIYWENCSYKLYIEPINEKIEFQVNHFTANNGKVLSIRCIDNYFGGLIDIRELSGLYSIY
jgi:hypothetical protein